MINNNSDCKSCQSHKIIGNQPTQDTINILYKEMLYKEILYKEILYKEILYKDTKLTKDTGYDQFLSNFDFLSIAIGFGGK